LTLDEITDDLLGRYIGGLHRSARTGYAKGYCPHNGRGLPRLLNLLRESGVLPFYNFFSQYSFIFPGPGMDSNSRNVLSDLLSVQLQSVNT
jgi:hypothetical protein